MKKLYSTIMLLAMMVAALSLTACSSSDDDDIGYSPLVGTWQGVAGEGWGFYSDEAVELVLLHFKNDGTYIDVIENEYGIEIGKGTWRIQGHDLIRTIEDEGYEDLTWPYEIKELTSDRLVLSTLGFTGYYKKVSDSVILNYINGNNRDDGYNTETSGSVYLDRGGTLSSMIPKSQASELKKLKISGHIDARDFDYIKWDCMKIEEIDLSDAIIDKYTGVEGTEEGNNKTYAANEIPSGAFFYWQNVHKYVYDGMPIDEGMASLKKIVLPKGIRAIRRNAFARAYNLTEINIPEGVESIDFVAFAICTSLEELKLPSSLKTVGQQAFADMTSMKRFYVEAKTPPIAYNNSFQGIPNNAVLYVPKGTEDSYRNAEGWNTFTQIIEL